MFTYVYACTMAIVQWSLARAGFASPPRQLRNFTIQVATNIKNSQDAITLCALELLVLPFLLVTPLA